MRLSSLLLTSAVGATVGFSTTNTIFSFVHKDTHQHTFTHKQRQSKNDRIPIQALALHFTKNHYPPRAIRTSLQSTKERTETGRIKSTTSTKRPRSSNTNIKATKPKTKRSWTYSATTITGNWRQNFEALKEFAEINNHTRVPYNYSKNPRLGRWVMRQRTLYNEMQTASDSSSSTSMSKSNSNSNAPTEGVDHKKTKVRPANVLTQERIEALQSIGFSFESPRKRTWHKRFDELCQYRALHGDCLVPLHYKEISGLGVWVMNQRTQYRNLLTGKKNSNLTPEKIAALKSVGFVWDTQRNDQWKRRFDELVDFKNVYGHCSVPERYYENPQLGTWVTNQRTAFKNFFSGSSSANAYKGLTKEKIAALESIGFCWDQTTYNWYSMYERLKHYTDEKMKELNKERDASRNKLQGQEAALQEDSSSSSHHYEYFHVPPEEVENRDLRQWIAVQRREYSHYMHNKNLPNGSGAKKRSSMTPRRIRALEEIKFPWSINKQKYKVDGPTVDDWTKLFQQMREQGIDKNVRPKEHWFEGQSIFEGVEDQQITEKDSWTDDDLLELWNSEDDE